MKQQSRVESVVPHVLLPTSLTLNYLGHAPTNFLTLGCVCVDANIPSFSQTLFILPYREIHHTQTQSALPYLVIRLGIIFAIRLERNERQVKLYN